MEALISYEEVDIKHFVPDPLTSAEFSKTFAFTDGACSQNGKPGAKAAFASLIINPSAGKGFSVKGPVASATYLLNDKIEGDVSKPVQPSNNRGELLGIIYAMHSLIQTNVEGCVEIVSDSRISIMTLTTWLPARQKKNTVHELKNTDLVLIAAKLLDQLRLQCTVTFRHVNSHKTAPVGKGDFEMFLWSGNDAVDRLASTVTMI